jgi:hypothetical protein
MLGYSSVNVAYLGYLDQARARADEGVLEARRLRHFYTLGFCLLQVLESHREHDA